MLSSGAHCTRGFDGFNSQPSPFSSILNALLESLSTGGVFFEKRHRRIIRSRRRFQRSGSCLCSCLHNFLIDQRCAVPEANTPSDALTLAVEGTVPMERAANGEHVPGQLLEAGDHFNDDINYTVRRSIYQAHQGRSLPRTAMIAHVANKGMSRPVGLVIQTWD